MLRGLDLSMTALFALAAVVQFNDPDPWRWVAVYGAACALAALAAFRARVPPVIHTLVAGGAALWAVSIVAGGPPAVEYLHMFDAWEMESPAVESAREATGLVIVAAWMSVLGGRARRAR